MPVPTTQAIQKSLTATDHKILFPSLFVHNVGPQMGTPSLSTKQAKSPQNPDWGNPDIMQ